MGSGLAKQLSLLFTNLMVMRPGGYAFGDYLRMGVPLTILTGILTVLIAPLVWPF